jgi:hypothetical protein
MSNAIDRPVERFIECSSSIKVNREPTASCHMSAAGVCPVSQVCDFGTRVQCGRLSEGVKWLGAHGQATSEAVKAVVRARLEIERRMQSALADLSRKYPGIDFDSVYTDRDLHTATGIAAARVRLSAFSAMTDELNEIVNEHWDAVAQLYVNNKLSAPFGLQERDVREIGASCACSVFGVDTSHADKCGDDHTSIELRREADRAGSF